MKALQSGSWLWSEGEERVDRPIFGEGSHRRQGPGVQKGSTGQGEPMGVLGGQGGWPERLIGGEADHGSGGEQRRGHSGEGTAVG